MKVAISVGEPSADEHMGKVVEALRAKMPRAEFRGMGGRLLRSLGVDTVVDSEKSASVMGFWDVLLSAREIKRSWDSMKLLLSDWLPDILVLVDYADFNLRLARFAHSLGVRVFYYITPQLWAWRSSRVRLFQQYVDHAAVIFPFEREFFERLGYARATFVGHPFADSITRFGDREAEDGYRNLFMLGAGLDPLRPLLAAFPGSRKSEVHRLLPPLLSATELLVSKHPEVQVALGVAPSVAGTVREVMGVTPAGTHLIEGRSLDILRSADAALLKSGTSNLQAAFYGTPFSMFFKASLGSELIVNSLVKIKEYSIVNVIRPGSVREVLQRQATPAALCEEMERLLFDAAYRQTVKANLREVSGTLQSYDKIPQFAGCKSSAERTATLIISTGLA